MKVYVYSFPDGKHYVGQTKYNSAKRAGNQGIKYKPNPELFAAFERYGYDNVQRFEYEVSSLKELDLLERFLIAAFNPEYNRNSGGSHGYQSINETKDEIKGIKESLSKTLQALKREYEPSAIARQRQNQEMRKNRVFNTMGQKYEAHPEWTSTTPFTITQTKEFFSSNTITAALKYGYITRPKRGVYYYKFIDTWNTERGIV